MSDAPSTPAAPTTPDGTSFPDTPNAPRALTVLDIIKIVLPNGTLGAKSWDQVCRWPPDLFAVVANIAERTGLYSELMFTAYWENGFVPKSEWIADMCKLGREWRETGSAPKRVQDFWHNLSEMHGDAPIDDRSPAGLAWKRIVFDLLVIADEACWGIGFLPDVSEELGNFQYTAHAEYGAWAKKAALDPEHLGGDFLPHMPVSLCMHVPRALLCVQPKTSTPAVGCTLRSLTHNLALLPSAGNVKTYWVPPGDRRGHSEPFNILVVPFPFSIPGRSFAPVDGKFPGAGKDRVFKLDPDAWVKLDPKKKNLWAGEFAKFLRELIDAANSELEPVHAIVLPETAMRFELATKVAEELAATTNLEMLLTGVLSRFEGNRNLAAMYHFKDNKVAQQWFQSKHHRWCLDADQIRRYHLGHVLDPFFKWWEQINVGNRTCFITAFRSYATLSVLVCEDLARYDPVLTVMNAIGPNLVIALLMDGPQLENRWPGRYATVLAEDPGSAVLTVTSLGMVDRSRNPGDPDNREIALWKEPNGRAKALKLPKGCHGLLLTLTNRLVQQVTLDGRGDGEITMQFALGGAHGVAHPNPPAWIGKVP